MVSSLAPDLLALVDHSGYHSLNGLFPILLVSRTESPVRDGPMERSGKSQSTRQNVGILPFKPKSRTVRDGPREFRVNKAREQSRVPKHRSRKEPVIRIIK